MLKKNLEGIISCGMLLAEIVVSMVEGIVKTVIVFGPVSILSAMLTLAMADSSEGVQEGLAFVAVIDIMIATAWGLFTLICENYATSLADAREKIGECVEILKATANRWLGSVWVTVVFAIGAGLLMHSAVVGILTATYITVSVCLLGALLSQFLTGEPDTSFWDI